MSDVIDLMERTRATVAYLNATSGVHSRRREAFAYLSLFHPEIPLARRLKLAAEIALGREDD